MEGDVFKTVVPLGTSVTHGVTETVTENVTEREAKILALLKEHWDIVDEE